MGKRLGRWIARFLIGAAIGAALGLAIGWWIWPVSYTNTAPDVLRQDYRDDYVLMTARAYAVESDLDSAHERLALLNPEKPSTPVIELAERLVEDGAPRAEISRLAHLAWALGATTPKLTPYLESGT